MSGCSIVALGGERRVARAAGRGAAAESCPRSSSARATRKIRVVLAGMEAPPNFGRSYTVSFHDVYPDLAETYKVAFVPFLLDGVAGIESLNQRDGIHPTAEGARIVADNCVADASTRPMLQ